MTTEREENEPPQARLGVARRVRARNRPARRDLLRCRTARASVRSTCAPRLRPLQTRAQLGEGGMATVYVAADQLLEREVAVKCIKSDLKGDDDASIRFHDEAKIMSMLAHPGAVPVHDLGKLADGRWFLAMKKVRGSTFKDLLAKRTPTTSPTGRRCSASSTLRARLPDRRGGARAARHPSRSQARERHDRRLRRGLRHGLGAREAPSRRQSPGHADSGERSRASSRHARVHGPEQARGKTNTTERQADVFSLGVMLYEILTGNRPFGGMTCEETLDQVLKSDPPNPRTLNPSLPRDLSEICMKAIAKDPTKRYASAKDLADDIERFRQSLPVTAARAATHRPPRRLVRRNPRLAAAVGDGRASSCSGRYLDRGESGRGGEPDRYRVRRIDACRRPSRISTNGSRDDRDARENTARLPRSRDGRASARRASIDPQAREGADPRHGVRSDRRDARLAGHPRAGAAARRLQGRSDPRHRLGRRRSRPHADRSPDR